MFVRWKTRQLLGYPGWGGKRYRAGHALYAVLVRSERVEGKPRQRVVKHLGHIRAEDLGDAEKRRSFWARLRWPLDKLGLDAETRARIEEQVARKVPKPAEARPEAMLAELEATIRRGLGKRVAAG